MPSESYEESMRTCQALVWAMVHGGTPAGAIIAKQRDDATRCSGDCESAESDALADAIAAFRRIVDKACSCGDDETCAAEVHADYQTWSRGPGSTGDRGSDAQAAEIGAELQRLMECDAELGRRVLSR